MIRKLVSRLGIVAAVSISAMSPVLAAEGDIGNGALVSPTQTEFSAKAGDQVSGKLLVNNEGTIVSDYRMSAESASIKNEDYERDFEKTTNPEKISTWVSFDKPTFRLEPGEKTNVYYTISIPKNAAPGTHFGTLFVSTTSSPNRAGISSQKKVGSHVFVAVQGQVERGGRIESFTAKLWQTGAPLESYLRITNTGNVHFFADTNFVVTDIFGNAKYKFSNNLVVLPETTRRIPLQWEKAPSFGLFKLSGTVKFLDKEQPIPPRYVLVLSPLAFLLTLLAVVTLVTVAILTRPKNVKRKR